MKSNKTIKFALGSALVIGILWFLKYKIYTPKPDGAGTDDGKGNKEGETSNETVIEGSGMPPNLSTLNNLANNLPQGNTGSSSTVVGQLSLGTVGQSHVTTTTPTRNPGTATVISTPSGMISDTGSVTAQLGFNGKKSFGFIGEERKLSKFL